MAVNLTAVFRVRDQGTSRLRQITQMMNRMNQTSRTTSQSMTAAQTATNRLGNAVSTTSNRMGGFAARVSRLHVSSSGLSASLGGMQSTLIGLAGAYLTAQGAAKAFDATIGAAARYQQSEVAVKAIFNDDDKSDAYLKLVDKMAIDSPLLNSTEMLASSKGLVAMTKSVDELGKAWSIIEKLMVLDPTQGTDGAAFALKEMFQGDSLSMVERFGLSKKDLNRIKKLAIPQQLAEITKLLDGMGITQKTVEAMGSTTLGYWSQIGERVEKFLRQVGSLGNSKLGDTLGKIVDAFDNADLDGIAAKLDEKLASIVDKAIAFGKFVWKWKEPIAYVAGAITAALGAFAVVGVIAALANPVGLIAAGIAAAAVGVKALYDNSETFRGIIGSIIGKVKSLVGAFKTGGTSGLIDAILPPDIAKKVNTVVGGIKSKISDLMSAFKTGGVGGLFDEIFGEGSFAKVKAKFEEVKAYVTEKVTQFSSVFGRLKGAFTQIWTTISSIISNLWTVIQPYLSGLWNLLQILGDVAVIVFNNVIAPAISLIAQLFSTLWTIVQPIINGLAKGFELLTTVIKWLWDNALCPLVEFILTGVKGAFDILSGALAGVQGWFETLSGWISTVYSNIKDFIGFIGNAKLPDWAVNGIRTGVNFIGNVAGLGGDKGGKKSHYSGLDSVPYDGYSARLHKGERVLTARENKEYFEGNGGSSTSGVVITGNNFTVREDADIEKIAYSLAKLIERQAMQVG
ncbi:phage tail tape measure protein [Lysinibacillus sp. NPDC097162]|uniref:phage tail protein n=1 Tax=Lysinibacillus sp. NPDC097162 TaxID=3364140 RepID=UPI00380C9D97